MAEIEAHANEQVIVLVGLEMLFCLCSFTNISVLDLPQVYLFLRLCTVLSVLLPLAGHPINLILPVDVTADLKSSSDTRFCYFDFFPGHFQNSLCGMVAFRCFSLIMNKQNNNNNEECLIMDYVIFFLLFPQFSEKAQFSQ